MKTFKDITQQLAELHERKNHDYGNSFGDMFAEFAHKSPKYSMVYAIGHLQEKLNRIKSLSFSQARVNNESLEDSLLDLASYAIMTLLERQNESIKNHRWENSEQ